MKLIKLLLPLSSVLLIGCSNTVQNVVVAPQVSMNKSAFYQNKNAKITTTDLRTSNHIIQILSEGKAADLISTKASLSSIIEQQMKTSLKNNGLMLDEFSTNTIEIIVNQAQVSVKQELMKYQAQNIVELTIRAENGQQVLTKSFKTSGSSNGPLRADIAVLERDFNQQLGKLLQQIVLDKEIQQFIH